MGKQSFAAGVNLLSYWVLQVPLVWFLSIYLEYGYDVVWMASSIPGVLQVGLILILVCKTNWKTNSIESVRKLQVMKYESDLPLESTADR